MTAKRYKKLLMAKGYSKYAAEQIVRNERDRFKSYQESYDSPLNRLYIYMHYKLVPAWNELRKGAKRACQILTNQTSTIISQVMEGDKSEKSKEK